jgi:hypothetical protein
VIRNEIKEPISLGFNKRRPTAASIHPLFKHPSLFVFV